jgi:hypothetical protein
MYARGTESSIGAARNTEADSVALGGKRAM